jgi:hypothetical protein
LRRMKIALSADKLATDQINMLPERTILKLTKTQLMMMMINMLGEKSMLMMNKNRTQCR